MPNVPVYKYPNNPNTCLQYKKILIKETYTSLSHVSIVYIFFTLKPPTSNTHQTERTRSSLSHLERKRPLHKNRRALLDLKKKVPTVLPTALQTTIYKTQVLSVYCIIIFKVFPLHVVIVYFWFSFLIPSFS